MKTSAIPTIPNASGANKRAKNREMMKLTPCCPIDPSKSQDKARKERAAKLSDIRELKKSKVVTG